MTTDRDFPTTFLWGAATASYQIEGAVAEDGRAASIWDTFSRVPGAVLGGETGDVACDHYHRMPEDVRLIRDLGLSAYRFSVAWPRVRPDGGEPNVLGIGFYDRLVDNLLEADVLPWITLYHWDLPQALEDTGGWTSRDTVDRFVEYALTTYDALGDRVRHWTTLNEPWCSAFLGHTGGQHAPGRQEGAAGLVAAHHLMLAHGRTIQELRRRDNPDDRLGITLNLTVADPFDADEPADVAGAERVDTLFNRVFLDPIFHGKYADSLLGDGPELRWRDRPWHDVVRDGDLGVIHAPLDVLGVNYYHGEGVSGRPHPPEEVLGSAIVHPSRPTVSPFLAADDLCFPRRGLPTTGLDWEVQPEGLTRLLKRLRDEYAVPPIYITENGAAFPDTVVDGVIDDPDRIAFFDGHLRAVRDAMADGVDVRGYFAWSLMDNYEWAYGYSQRFGIVYVDYPTQQRIPKASAAYFTRIAADGRLDG